MAQRLERRDAEACDGNFVRELGAERVSTRCVVSPALRIETISLSCEPSTSWHFCQPNHALFWQTDGVKRFRGTVGQSTVDNLVTASTNLTLVPGNVEIKASWDTQSTVNYVVVFFERELIAPSVLQELERPMMFFGQRDLRQSINNLRRESLLQDGLFDIYALGWLHQTLAQLVRVQRGRPVESLIRRGGLPPSRLRKLIEFIEENLTEAITIREMADIADVSERHLIRVFEQSTGVTPHRYVVSRRIARARRMLLESDERITDVALSCGYRSIQHFSSAFREETTFSPSAFRSHHCS
ncbi:MAG TPA: AraC family transcriptional regulator [Sphingobium sp.]